ncbi:MAG: ABC transporter substrate-binding protein [Actinomycetota bacterium]
MTRKMMRFAVVAVALALAAAACSSSGDDSDGDSGTASGPDTASGLDAAPGAADGGNTTGVTDDSIKVGALILDSTELADLGFGVEIGDNAEQFRTFFEDVEVAGRSVEVVTASFSAINQETQQQACLEMTQDEEVFLVVVLGGPQPETLLCVTEDNETAVISTQSLDQEIFDRSDGRLFTLALPLDRAMATAVDVFAERGDLEGKTIGVVLGDNPGDRRIVDEAFVPALEEAGLEVAQEVTLPCDGAQCDQYEPAVEQLQAAGVDAVFTTINVVAATSLVSLADAVGYDPEWFATEVGSYNTDVLIQRMEAAGDAYGGTLLATATSRPWTIDVPAGEFEQGCNDTYTEATGVTHEYGVLTEDAGFGAVAQVCFQADIVAQALELVGEDLTQERFIAALEELTEFTIPNSAGDTGSFGPDKHWAVNDVTVLTYDTDCTCWVEAGDGEPIPVER